MALLGRNYWRHGRRTGKALSALYLIWTATVRRKSAKRVSTDRLPSNGWKRLGCSPSTIPFTSFLMHYRLLILLRAFHLIVDPANLPVTMSSCAAPSLDPLLLVSSQRHACFRAAKEKLVDRKSSFSSSLIFVLPSSFLIPLSTL